MEDVLEFRLPITHVPTQAPELPADRASLSCPLDRDNRGYVLLQKMGWVAGRGLGKAGDGLVEPIPVTQHDGLGLGKAAEYDRAAEEATEQRRALTTEILLREEDDDAAREARAARNASEVRIQAALKEAHAEFYCDTCRKQYRDAMELSNHLSSYDHHHTKRFKEMREGEASRKRAEREAKEARRALKDERAASLQPLPLPPAAGTDAACAPCCAQPSAPGAATPPATAAPVPPRLDGPPLKFSVSMGGKKSGAPSKSRPVACAFGPPPS
ncbi:hypothetical protein KFE25_005936 [Diacronema lutheri]|uniref:G-patch domain-containing protein n=1 Tax=Diacronema lutheri TaxID=2081491 RepID=A0A8J5XI76_DIALT|nr:hypothetical protein KFE25_005936 [Diacronema lutheri]